MPKPSHVTNNVALIDTHAHLNSKQLFEQRASVIERALEAGVQEILCIGIDVESSRQALSIAEEFRCVHAVVGIQPNYCQGVNDEDFGSIVSMAQSDYVVGIGETGLDLYWDDCPLTIQQDFFRRHIRLSKEVGKPFVVHMRDCPDEMVTLLNEYQSQKPLSGVMHSFTGDTKCVTACLDLGLHISFAGMVTYKNASELRHVASQVPLEKILIETDSPYLSPEPVRKKRPNEPAQVVHTARCLADLHGMELQKFSAITTQNAKSLFGI